jgi:hypothetical protein
VTIRNQELVKFLIPDFSGVGEGGGADWVAGPRGEAGRD